MPTALNFTGRKAIDRGKINIVVRPADGGWTFDASFDASSLGPFPGFAEIWLEAHRDTLWMHWPWGTIAEPQPPNDRSLSEFNVPAGIWFRLKVVQPPGHEHNKLLAEVGRIPFVEAGKDEDKRRPLLVPVPNDLGNQLWRLDIEEEPILYINEKCRPTWADTAKDPHFISLVYPQAMRMILERALLGENSWTEGDENDDSWESQWVAFARILGAPEAVPDRDDRDARIAWIDEAVELFASENTVLEAWNSELDPGGGA